MNQDNQIHTMVVEPVIEAFNNWNQPWTFFDEVYHHPALSAGDRQWFAMVWHTAMDEKNWKHAALVDCVAETTSALQQAYPLSQAATDAVVNAAAYQWK
ncbi:hypothetical protein [Deminuibacter soli]|uniref:Uncharacterized protein n=1 Tax=Deminuibacter soli TaxID=2291815 RepID=A0A3E1NQB4_9BACT|nr:hypothetical protein [Deminuibacter soli]RFM30110.1 hypothetical protein DXN05_03810 [Deminuibacter soli]